MAFQCGHLSLSVAGTQKQQKSFIVNTLPHTHIRSMCIVGDMCGWCVRFCRFVGDGDICENRLLRSVTDVATKRFSTTKQYLYIHIHTQLAVTNQFITKYM